MAKDLKGFLKIPRKHSSYRPVCERVNDFSDVVVPKTDEESEEQAGRCMDCGTPFCHWACPVGNIIPEWNELMSRGEWDKAANLLDSTNNFPEITGRLCPGLCEYACVLGINNHPVTIRENELAIIERAFKKGTVSAKGPAKRTGKKVAVVGSGPAGMAAASQLNRMGHTVTLFEKAPKVGGYLRYGIPDFKLEKWIVDRRVDLMKKEGVKIETGVDVGTDYKAPQLLKDFDAVCLTGGSREPRDLKVPGRELKGIHFAIDYLAQSNMRVSGLEFPEGELIDARGKKVVVIGGGDTGADCVGTANRQGAICVVQIEVLPQPPECRPEDQPWPKYPMLLKTSSSHEEGSQRHWAILTENFGGENGVVKKLDCVKVEFERPPGNACPVMKKVPGSGFCIEADLVVLAVGFVHPEHKGLLGELGVEYDQRGNVKTDGGYKTSVKKVFSAGDMRRGQSLIVWAIAEGREAAAAIDGYLGGR
jgi:glutamate synthase (NADPH/NADH) small chain